MTEEILEDIDSEDDELEVDQEENNQPEVDKKSDLTERERQLLARVKKAEAKVKKFKETLADEEDTKPLIKKTNDINLEERFERLELKGDGYSTEEIDYIMKNGGSKALKDPYIKKTIDVMRNEKVSEDAIPDSSAKSGTYKNYTSQDLKKMSLDELDKIVPRD